MNPLRIVVDTNVLISVALKPSGEQARLVNLLVSRAFEICVSEAMLAEYREVFGRAKLSHVHPDVFPSMLALIERRGTRFTPDRHLTISSHDSDNRFCECADAADADYIVTGNLKHFPKPYKNTKIIVTRKLLELLAGLSG